MAETDKDAHADRCAGCGQALEVTDGVVEVESDWFHLRCYLSPATRERLEWREPKQPHDDCAA